MRKKLKAVLFDMDGVLFNSMPYHSEAWHQVMKTHGLDLSREEAYMHEGRTGASTINIVFQRELGHTRGNRKYISRKKYPVQFLSGSRTYARRMGTFAESKE